MDSYLIQFSDNETQIVTSQELEKMETEAMKYDGFYSWIVIRKVNPKTPKNSENETNI